MSDKWTKWGKGGFDPATSVKGTANQITATPSATDVTLSIPADFRPPGTVSLLVGNLDVTRANNANPVDITVKNTSANASSNARLIVESAGGVDTDQQVSFQHTGIKTWAIGQEGNNNSFVIAESTSLSTASLNHLTIDTSGNVNIANGNLGIGLSTTPSELLHVSGTAGAGEPIALFEGTVDSSIRLLANDAGGGESYTEYASNLTGANGWQTGLNDDIDLEFMYGTLGTINNTQKMVIKSTSGFVCIGDDFTPSDMLQITNDQDAQTAIRIDNTNSGTSINHTALLLHDGGDLEAFYRNNNNTHVSQLGSNHASGVLELFGGASKGMEIDASQVVSVTDGNAFRVKGATDTDYLEISMDETNNYAIIGTNNQATQAIWIKTGTADDGALVVGDVVTDATNKGSRVSSWAYNTAEPRVAGAVTTNGNGFNWYNIGGGTSSHQAVTLINIYAAATTNTATGTNVASFSTTAFDCSIPITAREDITLSTGKQIGNGSGGIEFGVATAEFTGGIINLGQSANNGVIYSNASVDIFIDANNTGTEVFRISQHGTTSGGGVALMTVAGTTGHVTITTGGLDVDQGFGINNVGIQSQQAHIADPSGGATVDAESRTAIAAINALIETYGLMATS